MFNLTTENNVLLSMCNIMHACRYKQLHFNLTFSKLKGKNNNSSFCLSTMSQLDSSIGSSEEELQEFDPPPILLPKRSLRQRELTDKHKESIENVNEALKSDPASEEL